MPSIEQLASNRSPREVAEALWRLEACIGHPYPFAPPAGSTVVREDDLAIALNQIQRTVQ